MSSDLSKYIGNKVVRWLGGQTMPAAPASIYLALFNGDPKGAGTEVTTTVRAAGRLAPTWTVPASSATLNVLTSSADVDFGASDNDVTVTHVAMYDAASSGNQLASKALPAPASVIAGGLVKFITADLAFTIGS